MTRFSADWLQRREPHDRRARAPAVLAALAAAFAELPSVTVVDLACGTGALMRAIAGILPKHQHWRLVDNDLGHLMRVAAPAESDIRLSPLAVDLTRDLEAALDGPVDLVATSAFLDLVSASWLDRLVTEIVVRNLPFYASLSYDGRIGLDPADETDETIVSAFNRHQTRDKGFGASLGPAAVEYAIERFRGLGYEVTDARADWAIGPDDVIQDELIGSLAGAARELVGVPQATIDGWATRRRIFLAARRSSLTIGHTDFFACPTGRR